MYFVVEFGLLLDELGIWLVRHLGLRDSTIDEFLDLQPHILEFASPENHHKHEFLAVGRSGCRLSLYVKKLGEGTGAVKNSRYFPACNAVEMLKTAGRLKCTGTKGCIYAREKNMNKKSHF